MYLIVWVRFDDENLTDEWGDVEHAFYSAHGDIQIAELSGALVHNEIIAGYASRTDRCLSMFDSRGPLIYHSL